MDGFRYSSPHRDFWEPPLTDRLPLDFQLCVQLQNVTQKNPQRLMVVLFQVADLFLKQWIQLGLQIAAKQQCSMLAGKD